LYISPSLSTFSPRFFLGKSIEPINLPCSHESIHKKAPHVSQPARTRESKYCFILLYFILFSSLHSYTFFLPLCSALPIHILIFNSPSTRFFKSFVTQTSFSSSLSLSLSPYFFLSLLFSNKRKSLPRET
jgi:hypothetical protein